MKLISLAKNPVPSGAVVAAIPGYDGSRLRYALWEPTRGPRKGTVCIFPGRGEFIEKYFETVADLRRRGFCAVVLDWRGQGGSQRALRDPGKGHVTDFTQYERDLVRLMTEVVVPQCMPPYFALGHSMGGNVLLRHAVLQAPAFFERLVLTAPLLAFNDKRIGYPQTAVRRFVGAASFLGLGSRYVPGGTADPLDGVSEFQDNVLTSDFNRWQRNMALLRSAPEYTIGAPTLAWMNAAYRSCSIIAVPGFARQVRIPTLMFAAGQDRLVSTRAIEEFGVRLKVGSHMLISQARHEVLQENDNIRQQFWSAFDAYIGSASVAA